MDSLKLERDSGLGPDVSLPMGPADILVSRVQAEIERTGRVDRDRVLAIAERRHTDPDVLRTVLSRLESMGLIRTRKSGEVEGWTPSDAENTEAGFSIDPLGVYLREIGKHPLLMPDDERTLGRRIRAGRSLLSRLLTEDMGMTPQSAEDASSHGFLRQFAKELDVTPAERTLLVDAAHAEDRFYVCNLRLVVSVARKTAWNRPQSDRLDVIQAGNEGLVTAVQKFDHTMGYKFSTYATWWIRQSITRHLANNGRTIRLPVHVVEKVNRIRRVRRMLESDLTRAPTLIELAESCDMDPAQVQFLIELAPTTTSLDKPIGTGEITVGDLVADRSPSAIEAGVERMDLARVLAEILHDIPERNQEVIRLRFGLIDGRARTLEEVGSEFGVTRERIRQIEASTLKLLKGRCSTRHLQEYL